MLLRSTEILIVPKLLFWLTSIDSPVESKSKRLRKDLFLPPTKPERKKFKKLFVKLFKTALFRASTKNLDVAHFDSFVIKSDSMKDHIFEVQRWKYMIIAVTSKYVETSVLSVIYEW